METIIDCVDVYKQLAFDHPLLSNHTVQVAGATEDRGPYHGVGAQIGLWGIPVEPNEWSQSSVMVTNNNGNYVEAGWTINPTVLGDNRSRFFAYWIADGSKQTGCYNLLCLGLQVSQKVALGAFFDPLSTYDGEQFVAKPIIYKDALRFHWWLLFGQEPIGYWPLSIFSNLEEPAVVQWRGAVLNTWNGGHHHTTNQMGNGHFAQEGWRKASFFASVYAMDSSNNFKFPKDLYFDSTVSDCYNTYPAFDIWQDLVLLWWAGWPEVYQALRVEHRGK